MTGLLDVQRLGVAYVLRGSRIVAVDDVSLRISTGGQTLGVVGESGSGKSTLALSLLRRIDPPGRIVSGNVIFEGRNVLEMAEKELREYRWQQVAMIYQYAMNSLNPVKKIWDPIAEVLREHTSVSKSECFEVAHTLLTRVGIPSDRIDSYPHELSGGMRQRVVIALSLALSPKLLIADEPTSALDVVIQNQIISLLRREVNERHLSLMYITHDIALLVGLVEMVAVMFRGEIVEQGSLERVFRQPLHPYTQALLASVLEIDSPLDVLSSSSRGVERSSHDYPVNGCKYAGRCPFAFDKCIREKPELRQLEGGRLVACHKYN